MDQTMMIQIKIKKYKKFLICLMQLKHSKNMQMILILELIALKKLGNQMKRKLQKKLKHVLKLLWINDNKSGKIY